MHDCDQCGSVCYCDMDDCLLPAPLNCIHHCPEETDEPVLDDDEEQWCGEAGPMGAVCDLDRDHGGNHRGWSNEGRTDWLPVTNQEGKTT